MEQNYTNSDPSIHKGKSLTYKHISHSTDDILSYINDRRKGIVKSLKTRWDKFNKACMGGIEPNVIIAIAGISGSGKSSLANSLESDLIDLNPTEDIVVLSFNFEMLSSRQVGRKLSYKLTKTTSELYSSSPNGEELNDKDYNKVLKESEAIKKYPIYYVDSPGTVEEIRETIMQFSELPQVKGKWLVIILDHTLLTKGKTGDTERQVLTDLQRLFMEIKKFGKNTIIQLSQMNREIEDKDRINNPNLHFPTRRDIFGSDSLFQTSDYVIVIHRPELLGIKSYGINNWPVKDKIYMHILKNREGEPKILSFINNLKFNRIDEYNPINIT
jgi:replicative DNA helicase